jgi:hypothetical protein
MDSHQRHQQRAAVPATAVRAAALAALVTLLAVAAPLAMARPRATAAASVVPSAPGRPSTSPESTPSGHTGGLSGSPTAVAPAWSSWAGDPHPPPRTRSPRTAPVPAGPSAWPPGGDGGVPLATPAPGTPGVGPANTPVPGSDPAGPPPPATAGNGVSPGHPDPPGLRSLAGGSERSGRHSPAVTPEPVDPSPSAFDAAPTGLFVPDPRGPRLVLAGLLMLLVAIGGLVTIGLRRRRW